MKSALISLALLAGAAHAQPCLPNTDTAEWSGGNMVVGASANGAWVTWLCLPNVFDATHQSTRVMYVGTLTQLPNVGGRVQTIIKAADPLKSLQTLPQRVTVLPLTDPSLAAVIADMKAQR